MNGRLPLIETLEQHIYIVIHAILLLDVKVCWCVCACVNVFIVLIYLLPTEDYLEWMYPDPKIFASSAS